MRRHAPVRAALIYQHATRERDEAIATAMGELFATARRKGTAKNRSARNGTTEGRVFSSRLTPQRYHR